MRVGFKLVTGYLHICGEFPPPCVVIRRLKSENCIRHIISYTATWCFQVQFAERQVVVDSNFSFCCLVPGNNVIHVNKIPELDVKK